MRSTAFAGLVSELSPAIRASVRLGCRKFRSLQRRIDLSEEDLVQATWLRLLEDDAKALRSYDRSISGSRAWVATIAERVVIDFLRKKQVWLIGEVAVEDLLDTGWNLEGRVLAKDQAQKLEAHLRDSLPERAMLIYSQYFLDSKSIEDIANSLNISVQVVHNWIFKIRASTKKFLADGPE